MDLAAFEADFSKTVCLYRKEGLQMRSAKHKNKSGSTNSIRTFGNFRAPDPKRRNSPGGPDLQRIYKICSKNMRKFKMQQSISKIRSKIQNDSPELSIVGAVSDLSVACKFTTHQAF
jgi:hypothetical protein